MASRSCDPLLLHHFTVFAYPFHHDLTARNRAARLRELEPEWDPWWARLSDHDLAVAVEAPGFFLPPTRGLLFPESMHLDSEPAGDHYHHWVQLLREWAGRGLGAFCRELPAEAVLRLTCRVDRRRRFESFTVVGTPAADGPGTAQADLHGCLDWVDALLFPEGIGFLLLKVRLAEGQPRLGQLIRLNQDLRLVQPPALGWPMPRLRFEATGDDMTVRELINSMTEGLAGQPALSAGYRPYLPFRRRGSTRPYADTEAGRGFGERCQVLSYACIHLSPAQRQAAPQGDFPSAEDRFLFEYACCIAPEQSVHDSPWIPAPAQIERLTRDNRLAPWRCWRALVLKETCVFLGTEDLPFNHTALPRNIESCYLPLTLFVLLQQYQLLAFANDLHRQVAQGPRKWTAARSLQDRFIAFRSRYWFSEVTRKPLGSDLYRLLQQGLEVPPLYQMLTDSIKDVREHHERERARSVEWLMKLVALVVSAPLACWGFVTNPQHRWLVVGSLALVAVVGATRLSRLWRSGKRPPWSSREDGGLAGMPPPLSENEHARAA